MPAHIVTKTITLTYGFHLELDQNVEAHPSISCLFMARSAIADVSIRRGPSVSFAPNTADYALYGAFCVKCGISRRYIPFVLKRGSDITGNDQRGSPHFVSVIAPQPCIRLTLRSGP